MYKKIAIAVSAISILGFSFADYQIKLQINQGINFYQNNDNQNNPENNIPEYNEPVIVLDPVINTYIAPSVVFVDTPFNISWSGDNVTRYTISSNNPNSGVQNEGIELGTKLSTSITPNSAGTYNYTLTGYNENNVTVTQSFSVVVEGLPTISSVVVNNNSSNRFHIYAGDSLTINSSFISAGATLSHNMPANLPSNPGENIYSFQATKTLNGVTKSSNILTKNISSGYAIDILVGKYTYNEVANGYLNTAYFGYSVVSSGSLSVDTFYNNLILSLYSASNSSNIHFNFRSDSNPSSMMGKKIWINGQLCSQSSYSASGGHVYSYNGCSSILNNSTGQTVRLYIQL